jgi:hypothetical protein
MLDFIKNFEFTPKNVLKVIGIVLVALIIGSFVKALFGPVLTAPFNKVVSSFDMRQGGVSGSAVASDVYYSDSAVGMYSSEGSVTYGKGAVRLSVANVKSSIGMPPIVPEPSPTPGNDAESYEVTDYSATIETRNKEDDCSQIKSLKKLTYVIFENSNDYDQGCNYTFKVEHSKVDEILSIIQALDPKNLSENVYTIKSQITDYTGEADILKKKLDSIDQTLSSALKAYEEITSLATRTQNSDALAKIIDSKINIIERLTQERINISSQLDRLERSKAEQLDRLKYTYFNVNIYESVYVDGQGIRDSWKSSVKKFIVDMNTTLQGLTINLVSLLFITLQYVLYFFILLVILKVLWKVTKYIWDK